MKSTLLIIASLFLIVTVEAQTVSIVSNKDIQLKPTTEISLPKVAVGNTINLVFKINDLPVNQSAIISIEDKNEGNAEKGTDYTILPNDLTAKIDYGASPLFTINLKVLTTKPRTIIFNLSCKASKTTTSKITLNLNTEADVVGLAKPDKTTPLTLPDTGKWSLRIVTGGNFDFFDGPKIKNFAGEISVSLPNIYAIKGFERHPFGVQFGLFNFHYFQSDSSGLFKNQDYYYLNPKDAFRTYDSTKIVKRGFSVSRKMDYNIWGVYLEPIMKLTSNEFAQLYFSGHIEAVATTQTYTPTVKYLTRDTFFYSPQNFTTIPKSNIQEHPAVPYAYKQSTFYDFYYGVGFPLKVNLNNKLMFSFTPTVGKAKIQTAISDDPFDSTLRFGNGLKSDYPGFFLARYQIVTTVAPVDIAFGGEYRSVFGKFHYLTNYIGASISLDKLKR